MKIRYVIIGSIFLAFCWTVPYLLEGKSLDSVLNQLFYSIGLILIIGFIAYLVISTVNSNNK